MTKKTSEFVENMLSKAEGAWEAYKKKTDMVDSCLNHMYLNMKIVRERLDEIYPSLDLAVEYSTVLIVLLKYKGMVVYRSDNSDALDIIIKGHLKNYEGQNIRTRCYLVDGYEISYYRNLITDIHIIEDMVRWNDLDAGLDETVRLSLDIKKGVTHTPKDAVMKEIIYDNVYTVNDIKLACMNEEEYKEYEASNYIPDRCYFRSCMITEGCFMNDTDYCINHAYMGLCDILKLNPDMVFVLKIYRQYGC